MTQPEPIRDSAGAEAEFDAEWYLETYPDVARSGLDPFQHYTQFGIRMGRKPSATGSAGTTPAISLAPRVALPDTAATADPDGPSAKEAQGIVVWAGDTDIAHVAAATDLAPLSTYARLIGADGIGASFSVTGTRASELDETAVGLADPDLGPLDWIGNAWMADEQRLRVQITAPEGEPGDDILRTGTVCVYQAPAETPEALRLVGEAHLPDEGPGFCDAELVNPFMPVLFGLRTADGRTLALALVPFPSLLRGGWHATERAAYQRGPDPVQEVWQLSRTMLSRLLAKETPLSIGRIEIDLDTPAGQVTGAERSFTPSLLAWLRGLFRIPVLAKPGSGGTDLGFVRDRLDPAEASGRPGGDLTLDLPADTIPTLAALTSNGLTLPDGTDATVGPFLVAEAATGRPLWSVALPQTAEGVALPVLRRAKPASATGGGADPDAHWLAPLHLGIRLCWPAPAEDVRRLLPRAPDLPQDGPPETALTLVLKATGPNQTERCLAAIGPQAAPATTNILIFAEPGLDPDPLAAAAARHFPEAGCQVLTETTLETGLIRLSPEIVTDRVLILEDDTLVYDPSTLAHLSAILDAQADLGSVSCALLHEAPLGKGTRIRFASAGIFPAGVSFCAAPRLTIHEPDCLQALPAATYPVLANSFQLCLIRRAVLECLTASDMPMSDLKFGLDSAAQGWRSAATTHVRAGTTRPALLREAADPLGLACLLPARWDDLLSRVTVLQQLRG